MIRTRYFAPLLAAAVMLVAVGPVAQGAPRVKGPAASGDKLTDDQVVAAMKKGIEYLLAHKNAEGNWDAKHGEESQHKGGLTALVLYSLMHAGLSLDDDPIAARLKPRAEEIAPVVKYLADVECIGTYSVGLQANALTAYRHNDDTLPALKRDHDYLIKAMGATGGYHYKYFPATPGSAYAADLKRIEEIRVEAGAARSRGDNATITALAAELKKVQAEAVLHEGDAKREGGFGNLSCAQYGALGAWALADEGIELPLAYWKTTDAFFRKAQQADGSWNYIPDGHGDGQHDQVRSMTTAGLATLYVAQEFLDTEIRLIPKPDKAINDGLAKVMGDFDPTINNLYYLYGIERVGLASGRKFFGNTDWYREGAANILKAQREDGHFDSDFTGAMPLVTTSYALLFLARGRNPVAFNKLEYNGPWNARPRDDANITRWMSKAFERPINWQSVNLKVDPEEWTDAPILLITGSRNPGFTEAEIAKLRTFINGGGTIFSTADGGMETFTQGCMAAGVKLVNRQFEFRTLTPEHALFSADQWTKITNSPRILGLSNGIREVWIHSPGDLGASWQGQKFASKVDFEVPANIYFYAAGRGMLHSRMRTLALDEAKEAPTRTIRMGRLEYAGNWDPEPGAWPRFGKIAAATFHTKLDVSSVKATGLDPLLYPIVHMVGTATVTFPADDAAKMKAYIDAGGTLFIDSGGGSPKFTASVNALLKQISPDAAVEQIPLDDPLVTGKAADATDCQKITLRRYAITTVGSMEGPKLMGLKVNGRWGVIFSPIDITSGFFSTNTGGIAGYSPESSQRLAQNIVLYAGQKK